jgi:hypothetical protein
MKRGFQRQLAQLLRQPRRSTFKPARGILLNLISHVSDLIRRGDDARFFG